MVTPRLRRDKPGACGTCWGHARGHAQLLPQRPLFHSCSVRVISSSWAGRARGTALSRETKKSEPEEEGLWGWRGGAF